MSREGVWTSLHLCAVVFSLYYPPQSRCRHSSCVNKLVSHNNSSILVVLMLNSLIGKGGGTITALQCQSNARIRLSQASGFFPNTRGTLRLIRK